MMLIFLHGAPAAGKLTVAQALLRSVPGRLFDNRAASTVFDFRSARLLELVQSVHAAVLNKTGGQASVHLG
jgi:hypothetical protein